MVRLEELELENQDIKKENTSLNAYLSGYVDQVQADKQKNQFLNDQLKELEFKYQAVV